MALPRPNHEFLQLQRLQKVKQSGPPPADKLGGEMVSFFKQCVAKRQTHLGKIAEAWGTLVPPSLSEHCSLESLSRGTLVVVVDSSSHLYELKQLLLAGIQQQMFLACKSAGLKKITLKPGRWYEGEDVRARTPKFGEDRVRAIPRTMDVDQLMSEAQQFHQRGDLRRAEPLYRQVLAARPDHAEALNMLGVLALQCGQPQAAIELMERSVVAGQMATGSASSRLFFYYNNLAEAYKATKRHADAARAFERALELKPGDHQARHSLAVALDNAGECDRAVQILRELIQAAPDYPRPYMSLGAILEKQAHYAQALELLDRAATLDPQYARARHGRAGIWLRYGDFERGWAEYEWRWRVSGFPGRPPRPGTPLWNGEDFGGRTILLFAEQGLGDTIQFIRYAPQVAARGGRVVVETPPSLVRLVRGVEGVSEVITPSESPPAYQVQLPLLSLPRVMGTRLETIPNRVPYITPAADVVSQWAANVGNEPTFRVGICWAGGQSQPHRSIPSALMGRIISNAPAGVRFYSLQKDRPSDDPHAPAGVLDLMDQVTDFADTAGLIAAMDLVISIDTAAAHLAGAMGKPTWVMLAHHADWRWLHGRMDSPWYPTMRLFKQEQAGAWEEVVERVGGELITCYRNVNISPT